MREQAEINKIAWEYNVYEAWTRMNGSPAEFAREIKANPVVREIHRQYFDNVSEKKIANPCGSNGRQAIPLALCGNDVTVFDISEGNKRYALELAKKAGVEIEYVLGDFCETDIIKYGDMFDIVYTEGGILHFFSDINVFMKTVYAITKPNGQLILSDHHPFRKIGYSGEHCDYFDTQVRERQVPFRYQFPEEERDSFPETMIRFYNLSEIINAVISSGFTLVEFVEHPAIYLSWVNDEKAPGEFTIVAEKIKQR